MSVIVNLTFFNDIICKIFSQRCRPGNPSANYAHPRKIMVVERVTPNSLNLPLLFLDYQPENYGSSPKQTKKPTVNDQARTQRPDR
jgi:hypothetical protein